MAHALCPLHFFSFALKVTHADTDMGCKYSKVETFRKRNISH